MAERPRYTAAFEPVGPAFRSQHIKGWQITCTPGTGDPPYVIALCTNSTVAKMCAAALMHAVETNLTVDISS